MELKSFIKFIPNKYISINSHYNFLTTNNNGRSLSEKKKNILAKHLLIGCQKTLLMLSINSITEYHSNARDGAFAGGHIAGYALYYIVIYIIQ